MKNTEALLALADVMKEHGISLEAYDNDGDPYMEIHINYAFLKKLTDVIDADDIRKLANEEYSDE